MKTDRLVKKLRILPDEERSAAVEKVGQQISAYRTAQGDDGGYVVACLDDVIAKYDKWKRLLPRVQAFYAIKCNDSSVIIDCLARIGCNFDCASKVEIKKVLSHGIHPSRVVYANPTKHPSFIAYASTVKVTLMTADNSGELHKIAARCPSAKILLRVAPVTTRAVQIDLSAKYGCSRKEAFHLMRLAETLSLHVVGISFHAGSGIRDSAIMPANVRYVSDLFDEAERLGFRLTTLDVGGGFPGHSADADLFELIATSLSRALAVHFPPSRHVTLIAEPGRYFVTSAFSLYSPVIGISSFAGSLTTGSTTESDFPVYFLSEGFFGCFNGIITEDSPVTPRISKNTEMTSCQLRGPTCHPADVILTRARLPRLTLFDWLSFADCGAYTTAISMSSILPDIFWIATEGACCRVLGGRRLSVPSDTKQTIAKQAPPSRRRMNDVITVT